MFGASTRPTLGALTERTIKDIREANDAAGKQGTPFGPKGLEQDGAKSSNETDSEELDGSSQEGRAKKTLEPTQGTFDTTGEKRVKYEISNSGANQVGAMRDGAGTDLREPTQLTLFTAQAIAPKEKKSIRARIFAEVNPAAYLFLPEIKCRNRDLI